MAELTDAEIEAANRRGRAVLRSTPLATSARYDPESGRIVVELNNGCTFSFPARIAQDLGHATNAQLAEIELSPSGFGLHWPQIDVDFTVPGLMAGRFGTARFMRERFGPHWDAQAAE